MNSTKVVMPRRAVLSPGTKTALTISIGMANPKRKFPEAWSEFLPDSLRLCTTSQLMTLHGAKQGPENHHQRGPGTLAVRYGRWLIVLSGKTQEELLIR